jgi:hypothetical protein
MAILILGSISDRKMQEISTIFSKKRASFRPKSIPSHPAALSLLCTTTPEIARNWPHAQEKHTKAEPSPRRPSHTKTSAHGSTCWSCTRSGRSCCDVYACWYRISTLSRRCTRHHAHRCISGLTCRCADTSCRRRPVTRSGIQHAIDDHTCTNRQRILLTRVAGFANCTNEASRALHGRSIIRLRGICVTLGSKCREFN